MAFRIAGKVFAYSSTALGMPLLALFLSAPAAAQEIPKQLRLSDAVRIALSKNSSVRSAQARLEQSTAQMAQARSTLLPQMDLNVRQAYLTVNLRGVGIDVPGVTGKSDPFGSMDARLALRMDLLNIANRQAWRSSRSRQDASQQLVTNAREIVVLDVVGAYLEALRARESRDALREQTKLASDLHQLTQDRVKQGVSAPLEANRALQQVNSLRQEQQEAEQSYVTAKLSLANLLQARITSDFEVDDSLAYGAGAEIDRDAAVRSALASRPDFRAAEASIRAAELQVQSAKAARIPTVSAVVSDGQSGESPVNNVNTYRVAGEVHIPIFTGGRIRGEIEEAQARLRETESSRDQLRSLIETEVLTAIEGVKWALQQVETSAANVQLSREEVQLASQRYTEGVTDNTEVVNAQDRVSRADDARVRAMYTLGLARANLARATGTAESTYGK